jgi:membrane protease YdiL (CAAX protease family)
MTQAQTAPASGSNARLALFWAVLGAIGTAAVVPYQFALNPALAEAATLPLPVLALLSAVQTGVLLFLLGWLVLRLGRPLGLDSPHARAFVEGRSQPPAAEQGLRLAAVSGVLGALVILVLDVAFRPLMPVPAGGELPYVEPWRRALAVLYGAITEELLLRLVLMTLLAWAGWKLAQRARSRPTAAVYWTAIVVAAVLFGLGHLPVASTLWPLTAVVVARTVLLNSVLGVAFGALYWRYGLEYAMLAHFLADIVIQGAAAL